MKIISYTDINGKKCYADVENFAATMSEEQSKTLRTLTKLG